ncbi:hypothetical protein JMN10_05600 [Capnocytophaga genosp. AHN8471]|jgi:hypothetical protein|uniref:Uncharacterized protein n=1 Tax=Capnocytophaga genosp. AHN8471 TaxID=327574 RepID=A0ABS1YX11_9FLAO|nr:hypothetical protein [Capnocytophaga genosp. AHN8471]MBM0650955.1 hypothetical protein [Capnocytophaga genosp. AHN8471]MBM0661663.1 hypothetical protein [Capnocytophaga genosp. AHN8471]
MIKQQKLDFFYTAILLLLFIGIIVVVVDFNSLVIETLQSIDDSTLITSKEAQMANELAILIKKCIAPVNVLLGVCLGLLAPELIKMVKQLSKFKNK